VRKGWQPADLALRRATNVKRAGGTPALRKAKPRRREVIRWAAAGAASSAPTKPEQRKTTTGFLCQGHLSGRFGAAKGDERQKSRRDAGATKSEAEATGSNSRGCGGRSKQRPYETGAAKNYDGLPLPGTFVRASWRCERLRKSKEPALRKELWVNPFGMNSFGIHETGPALERRNRRCERRGRIRRVSNVVK
jgi:hypothetical protein